MSAVEGVDARKVRVAVVGCGEFGRNHIRVYRGLENVELVGVFDQNAERGQQVAQEFSTRAFSSLGELRGAAEAASIAVPTAAHQEVGSELMKMGVDVLVADRSHGLGS
jgi:predicted dehydrogenase